jgi:Ca-activated chloride channel homolog
MRVLPSVRRRLAAPLRVALFAALAASLAPLGASAYAQSSEPHARITQVDTSRYPEITVYVSVEDGAGRPVAGLGRGDFTLAEEGRPVELTGFTPGGASPVAAALVIDHSLSMADARKIEGARGAAEVFVGQMRPGDRGAVIGFSSRAETFQAFTGDAGRLREAVGRLEPDGGTALYDSLIAGVDALRGESGRRALLLLSDGQDCRDDPECPDEYGSERTLSEAIRYAVDAGQPVYAIGLGRRGGYGRAGVDEAVLRRIAEETGGEYFHAPDAAALEGLYGRLSTSLQSEYALTYHSPRPFYDGTRRDITVAVGAAPAASAAYLQQHLLNVRSNPVIGFVLLVPLVWALLLPGWLRGRRARAEGEPSVPPAATWATAAAEGATIVQPPARRAFCPECGQPLREAARFCAGCGAAVAGSAPGGRP